MAGSGAPEPVTVEGSGLRVAVVATRWHAEVTDALLAGALRALAAAHVREPSVVRVPGAFELPVVVAQMAVSHDAVVALGLVVRGGTPHFEFVCDAATAGLTRVAIDTGTPVGFGLLTCDTLAQAIDRSGLQGSREDKGAEAALAAVETAGVLRGLRAPRPSAGFTVR